MSDTCPETVALLGALDAAGIEYERVSVFDALMSTDVPMFVYREGDG
ncbi:hypothetical protein [Mycolicibacterium lutetiense]|uniref:Glutaredoxin-related protein n=1 Tax=Mycolicibacterium lutetiense TaxID=1641992 RepID=A0ABS4ZSM6_9MYCO|nr:hypothetical protein [Mycolicibacterium lutetiense]MBP2452511.1 glutaredoxin-related protein [Mycolicibacterium lutetiense]